VKARGNREEEARKALQRLDSEAEKSLGASHGSFDEEDRIERLGKRLGRWLSYLLALGLLYYLWTLL